MDQRLMLIAAALTGLVMLGRFVWLLIEDVRR